MKNALKLLAIVLCVSMLVMAFAGCDKTPATTSSEPAPSTTSSEPTAPVNTDPIKIACIMPLTGNAAQSGLAAQRALDLQFELFNEKGGYEGRKVEISYFDDMNDSKESVNCAELVAEDDDFLCIMGPFNSSCVLATCPIFQEAGIPQLAPTGVAAFIDEYDHSARMTMDMNGRIKYSAQFMAENFDAKTCVLLWQQDDNGVQLSTYFPDFFGEYGGKVLASEAFLAGTQDFNAVLTSLKQYNPDFIHISGAYAEAASIISQMHDLGWDIPVVAMGSAMDNTLIELIGDLANRIIIGTPVNFSDDSAAFKDFLAAWAKKYDGEVPSNTMAVNFSEGALLAISAITYGCTDRDSFKAYCRNTPRDVEGLTKSYQIFDGEPNRAAYMMTVRDGVFTEWKEGMGNGIAK